MIPIASFSTSANKYFQKTNLFPITQMSFQNGKSNFYFYKDSSRR